MGNKDDPVDEAIYILLTTKTNENSYIDVYDNLAERYESWEDLIDADDEEIELIIQPAGLANLKTNRLKKLLSDIKNRADGNLTLDYLREMNTDEAEEELLSLHGVGIKTAKCILLYSLDREVLPVDVHTYKFAKELGLVDSKDMRDERGKLHKELEEMIPPKCRYKFHVNAVTHRRQEHRKKFSPGQQCQLIKDLEKKGLLPLP